MNGNRSFSCMGLQPDPSASPSVPGVPGVEHLTATVDETRDPIMLRRQEFKACGRMRPVVRDQTDGRNLTQQNRAEGARKNKSGNRESPHTCNHHTYNSAPSGDSGFFTCPLQFSSEIHRRRQYSSPSPTAVPCGIHSAGRVIWRLTTSSRG